MESSRGVMLQFDSELPLKSMKAVRNLSDWQGVLQHIMTATSAKAAMITLRDSKTCQIVDDVVLETTFHSPLICGFTIESAAYYLQELRTIDPWADAQRLHYPFRPTLMSTICDPASMPDNKFFKWLVDLGCRETVVIELNRMSGYWTALNLFFEEPRSDEAETGKRYLTLHSGILKEAWLTSQEFIHSKQSQQISLEQVGDPACVVNQNFEVLAHNQNFGHLQTIGAVELFGPRRRLSVEHSVVFTGSSDNTSGIRRHDSDATDYRAFMASFDPDPLHEGKREGHQLIVFKSPSDRCNNQEFPVHELRNLSAQEAKMLAAVQDGLSVSRAGTQIGVKRSRAFEIWASVKSKLAISNSHQVRTG